MEALILVATRLPWHLPCKVFSGNSGAWSGHAPSKGVPLLIRVLLVGQDLVQCKAKGALAGQGQQQACGCPLPKQLRQPLSSLFRHTGAQGGAAQRHISTSTSVKMLR